MSGYGHGPGMTTIGRKAAGMDAQLLWLRIPVILNGQTV